MPKPKITVTPPSSIKLDFKEFWNYRELLYFFTWRDIKVKYKQTFLGIGWVIIQPLGFMLLFTIIFSRNLHVQTNSIPYPVFVLSGMVLWNLFQSVVSNAAESITQASPMIRKIYFPRLILPISSLLAALLDFLISICLFFVVVLIYKTELNWYSILFIPASIIVTAVISIGLGLWLSALIVRFKDFKYLLPFFLQLVFFSSEIVYPIFSIQSTTLKQVFALNPLNASIELFRYSFTGTAEWPVIIIGIIMAILIAITGLLYFKKTEIFFADL